MMNRESKKKLVADAVQEISELAKKKKRIDGKPIQPPASTVPFANYQKTQAQNAIASYAQGLNMYDIAVLCDFTILGNGKKGMIFSADGFYSSDMNANRKKNPIAVPVLYEELAGASIKGSSEVRLILKDNSREEIIYGSIYSNFIAAVLNRIIEKLAEAASDSEAENASATDAEDTSGSDAEDTEASTFQALEDILTPSSDTDEAPADEEDAEAATVKALEAILTPSSDEAEASSDDKEDAEAAAIKALEAMFGSSAGN